LRAAGAGAFFRGDRNHWIEEASSWVRVAASAWQCSHWHRRGGGQRSAPAEEEAAVRQVSVIGGAAVSGQAPAEEEAAVRQVVQRLFDGMRARDTAAMASVFHAEARLYGLTPAGDVQVTLPSSFVAGIAGAPADLLLDEVLHDTEVRIDGPLATVWTYYDFFAGDDFSHCGYDAIQLLKVSGEWKIVALADTRRRSGCRQERGGVSEPG
jgi:hypothetical protein